MESWEGSYPNPLLVTPTKPLRHGAQTTPDKLTDQLDFPEGLASHDDEAHRGACRAQRCSRCLLIKHQKERTGFNCLGFVIQNC
jgi:hypothetical protein